MNKKNNEIENGEFNFNKYNWLIENANSFFEAAKRCSMDFSQKINSYPLFGPNLTNKAFACELYLKALIYLTKHDLSIKGHNLKNIYQQLNEEDRKNIYYIWLTFAGQNLQAEYEQEWFDDNLTANSDVFVMFRYLHEWAGAAVSLDSILVNKPYKGPYASSKDDPNYDPNDPANGLWYLNKFNAKRRFGRLSVHDGFLDQFAESLKKYNNEVLLSLHGVIIYDPVVYTIVNN